MPDTTPNTPRAARTHAEFVNLTVVGAAIFGRVTQQGKNGNGAFVVFTPAAFRASPSDKFTKFGELATGLSTDLASKVDENDTGKLLLFYLAGFKPTQKTPMKIFNVVELTTEQAGALFTSNKVPDAWSSAPTLVSKPGEKSATRAAADPF